MNYKDIALISAIISCDSQSPCNSSGEKENTLGESRLGSVPDAVRRSDDSYEVQLFTICKHLKRICSFLFTPTP